VKRREGRGAGGLTGPRLTAGAGPRGKIGSGPGLPLGPERKALGPKTRER